MKLPKVQHKVVLTAEYLSNNVTAAVLHEEDFYNVVLLLFLQLAGLLPPLSAGNEHQRNIPVSYPQSPVSPHHTHLFRFKLIRCVSSISQLNISSQLITWGGG